MRLMIQSLRATEKVEIKVRHFKSVSGFKD